MYSDKVMDKIKSTPRLASPSLIPGIPAKTGTSDSTYPKIIATAEKSPRQAVFCFINLFSPLKKSKMELSEFFRHFNIEKIFPQPQVRCN